MKKTLTINLNGSVFNIDEDAYQILKQYLNDLGRHFAADEKEEILKDIEARIAELFMEKLVNRNVVEINDVEEVIERLGQPSQFADEDAPTGEQPSSMSNGNVRPRRKRKLYRDTDNKRLGGVAAGVAAYLDWDVALVRLLFLVILLASFGWTLFIYILMWIFIPEASSVAQKLEMQGLEPNVDNISSHTENACTATPNEPSALYKIVKIIAIVVLSCMGIGLFASVLGVLIAAILLMFHLLPIAVTVNELILLVCIGVFLICPAIAIVMFCSYLVNSKKPRHKWVAWTLLSLWLLSIVGLGITSVNSYNHKDQWNNSLWNSNFWKELRHWDWDDDEDDDDACALNFINESRDCSTFHAIDAEEAIVVKYTQGDSISVEVDAPQNRIGRVRTEIRNGVLYIRNNNERMRSGERVTVWVTAPYLDRIKMSEACTFKGTSAVNFSNLSIEVEEASFIELCGIVDTLTVKAEEASRADLRDITAQKADIRADEASLVNFGTAKELNVSSSEASVVTHK